MEFFYRSIYRIDTCTPTHMHLNTNEYNAPSLYIQHTSNIIIIFQLHRTKCKLWKKELVKITFIFCCCCYCCTSCSCIWVKCIYNSNKCTQNAHTTHKRTQLFELLMMARDNRFHICRHNLRIDKFTIKLLWKYINVSCTMHDQMKLIQWLQFELLKNIYFIVLNLNKTKEKRQMETNK